MNTISPETLLVVGAIVVGVFALGMAASILQGIREEKNHPNDEERTTDWSDHDPE